MITSSNAPQVRSLRPRHLLSRVLLTALLAGAGASLASEALAIPNHPSSARGFASDMVKAYRDCDPGLATGTTQNAFFPRPACPPPVVESPSCLFKFNGRGKVKMTVQSGGDVRYTVRMRKLNNACYGEQLDFVVKYQQTNDDCNGLARENGCDQFY